ncbi:MAG: hypothetical protein H0U49_00045 [Parachlamydiaceae bacterium]|nr:hypothetical protein [Parachlamydiaceae bacterium]
MKEINIDDGKVILNLSKDDLAALINALNEVCRGFKVDEFEKQIGVSKEEAKNLLLFLSSVYTNGDFERFNYM